ncbi:V-type ATP synthase subunit D [Miniphocaeibacter halophilus]|uniref:V-type ATP synthase subunit D n=1 Tax=Miniphocaeibacter halophilus TaxID=2931922 RepID=A0AC61MT03_9FIRM|nr:V-type ATP synthase subunit D [Miniphocaeibacter halophilus]QQK07428.1 V-type ATP synthase subunit D [Miniphocaeibacter halophilus]
MAKLNVNPTRMVLSELKERLATSTRGHKLLKDKQDELMRRFIGLIRKNKELRLEVEEELSNSFKDFLLASAIMSPEFLDEAVSFPKENIDVDITTKNIMSVNIPVMKFIKTEIDDTGSIYPYGYAQTSADLDYAIEGLDKIMDKLLELAEVEKACQLMAKELEKTRRRVNALEYRTIPDLEETIKYIRSKLDENERATITRLMKVKDIIQEK